MTEFLGLYNNRRSEIEKFIEVMKFLENKEMTLTDEGNLFDQFFHAEDEIMLSYQDLVNIMKSNLSLMIYNLIEFSVTNLIECIYTKIKADELSYIEINDQLKKLWTEASLKYSKDPNANHTTFVKKSEEIIEKIISKSTITLRARDILPGGNLDGVSISETMKKHGITINQSSANYRPDILSNIKNKRNDLAHGSVSFVEALRNSSISDIETNANIVFLFLNELIENVTKYIEKKSYKKALT